MDGTIKASHLRFHEQDFPHLLLKKQEKKLQLSALPKDANFQSTSASKWHVPQVSAHTQDHNNNNVQMRKKWEINKIENMILSILQNSGLISGK